MGLLDLFSQKLNIKSDAGDDFDVLFNPNQYSISSGITLSEQARIGNTPLLQFTQSQRKKLNMELFWDTSVASVIDVLSGKLNEDVRNYTRKVANLMRIVPKTKRPPSCTIGWGDEASEQPQDADLKFIGVLTSLTTQFTYFHRNGNPLRARQTVEFTQFESPEKEGKDNPLPKSFPAQTYTVIEGDSLSSIAGNLWNDPGLWRLIAEENIIDNPKVLDSGLMLTIPPIED